MSRGKRKKAAEDFTRKVLHLLHKSKKALSHSDIAEQLRIRDDKRKNAYLGHLGSLPRKKR